MKNFYSLQYQILIFSLSAFYILYTLLEFPYTLELYSIQFGYNRETNLTGAFYYIYLSLVNNTLLLQTIFISKILFSLMLFFSKTRKIGLVFLLLHNLLFIDLSSEAPPEVRFLNFLILILIFLPDKKFTFFKSYKKTYWMPPRRVQYLVWIITGSAYFVSGYYKYLTPGWFEGKYLSEVLAYSYLSRWDIAQLLTNPLFIYTTFLLNYFILFTELTILPLTFHSSTKLYAFILLLLLHLGTFFFLDLTQVSLGLLVFQIYLFDPRWLRLCNKTNDLKTFFFFSKK